MLANRLRELAFLNPALEIMLADERDEKRRRLFFTRTASSNSSASLAGTRSAPSQADRACTRQKDEVFVECVMQYNDSYNDQILCFANSISNPDGGTHLTGFRSALTRAINQYAKANNLLKEKDPAISGDDVREGLVCVSERQAARTRASSRRPRSSSSTPKSTASFRRSFMRG